MKTLSVVIPFLNEERTICKTLEEIIAVDLSRLGYEKEIILVNDGSTDDNQSVIQKFLQKSYPDNTIQYIENDKNHGKWYSLKEWFRIATWDLFIVQDADSEYNPHDYLPLIEKLEKDNLDFVYGSRIAWIKKFKNNYSTASFLLGWLAVSFLTSLLTFKRVSDEPTCYKLYTSKLRKYLLLPPEPRFEWEPAITMLLLRKWFTYGEVPIHYTARKVAEGKKIKWKDGVKAITTLFRWRFKRLSWK